MWIDVPAVLVARQPKKQGQLLQWEPQLVLTVRPSGFGELARVAKPCRAVQAASCLADPRVAIAVGAVPRISLSTKQPSSIVSTQDVVEKELKRNMKQDIMHFLSF